MGGLNIVMWRGKEHENNDPNESERQIMKIVRWCLDTDQNGVIDHNRNYSIKCDSENNTPETVGRNELKALIKFHEKPEGIENYHYFLRNDSSKQDLYNKVSNELTDFIVSDLSGA